MKIYSVPTKTTVTLDHEKVIKDLMAGPVYIDKKDFSMYKALTMYMRNRNYGTLRPSLRSVILLQSGQECEVFRITLTNKPMTVQQHQNSKAGLCKVVRVADGVVFASLNKAIQGTEMPKGAKNFNTVARKVAEGASLFEASKGVFTLTPEEV